MTKPGAQLDFPCARLPQIRRRRIGHTMNPVVIIPARMGAARLPGKPLADIGGRPMIVRVLAVAEAEGIGPVLVAAGEREIAEAVEAAGGRAVLTDPGLASGSDRVLAALNAADPDRTYDTVVNLQGDLPDLPAGTLLAALGALAADPGANIATLVVADGSDEARNNPNIVKAVLAQRPGLPARALYFTRAPAPWGEGKVWKHVGIYVYRRAALERFCALKPSPLEMRERLEQLRALEAGMTIVAAELAAAPDGVDTPEDLERMRAIFAAKR